MWRHAAYTEPRASTATAVLQQKHTPVAIRLSVDAAVRADRAVIDVLRRLPFVSHPRMRCRLGHLPLGVAAVEPHGVHPAVGTHGERLPTTRARQRRIVREARRRERAALVGRTRHADRIAPVFLWTFVPLRPEHGECPRGAGPRHHHARRLFVVRARISVLIVDALRLGERRAAIIARRQIHVRRALFRRRPDCREGTARNRQRRRRVHRTRHTERRSAGGPADLRVWFVRRCRHQRPIPQRAPR